ncbi:MAG: NAD(P)-dependent alcohol dehydrogenase [Nocardioides sp.]|jgi:uncharacterized zinc-type alcohol dehydrogenase-like protein
MPTQTSALSVPAAGAPFEAVTIERRDLRDDDVRIEVAYAGICHSDIHTVRDEWGAAHYPIVTGHEIAGTVSAVGSTVTKFKVGDRVGVGCLVDSCAECEWCKNGQEMFCTKPAVGTYNAQNYDGEWAAGGYSQQIVVTERMVVNVPEGLSLDEVAPLLCAGITTYSPLKRWGAGPGKKVAIVGVGGLGHMGVKIAAAMGAEVSTLSRTSDKAADAEALGSSQHIATSDAAAMKAARGSFDLIINTVSADLDMKAYMRLLRPNGAMVNVGLPNDAYSIPPFAVIGGNKVLAGSQIGGIAETQEMLDFCAEHGLGATIETLDASDTRTIDQAYDDVVAGKVRYRYVIDTSTINPG